MAGFAHGPYFDPSLVTEVVQTLHWIAMQRFPVPQGEKVRPVDDASATSSFANFFSRMTGKLSVPSVDYLGAAEKCLATGLWTSLAHSDRYQCIQETEGWVSVVTLPQPETWKLGYTMMMGHPYGPTSPVHNYCTRSAALTRLSTTDFRLACMR